MSLRLRLGTCVVLLARQDQLLGLVLILHKPCEAIRSLAGSSALIFTLDIRYAVACSPDFVFEDALLPFLMFERTERLGARIVPAVDF